VGGKYSDGRETEKNQRKSQEGTWNGNINHDENIRGRWRERKQQRVRHNDLPGTTKTVEEIVHTMSGFALAGGGWG
jgi:hypothetical protein